ncbi:hypothetical protein STENM327S_09275 [Streptomyces tendae]
MSAVARRAGLGVATLYRRFPTRSALVTAAFEDQLAMCATAFDEAMADLDPGHGLYVLLEKVCTTLVTDRGFETVFMADFPEALDYDRERAIAEDRLSHLVQRARDAGRLREDFDPADIPLLLLAVSGLAGQPPETAVPAARRLLTYLFQSFRAHPPSRPGPLPPAPPLDLSGLRLPVAARTATGAAMNETPGDDRRLPPALADVARVEFDYADGDGIDFEPYAAFDSAEETTRWLRRWTGNAEADGSAYRVFGQDGAGGRAALWARTPRPPPHRAARGVRGIGGRMRRGRREPVRLPVAARRRNGPRRGGRGGQRNAPTPTSPHSPNATPPRHAARPRTSSKEARAAFPAFAEDLRSLCR